MKQILTGVIIGIFLTFITISFMPLKINDAVKHMEIINVTENNNLGTVSIKYYDDVYKLNYNTK